MFKKLISFVALCASVTGVAQAKDYRLTANDLRISKDSTIIAITDVGVCFDAFSQLYNYDTRETIYKKYKTFYPHLRIPVDLTKLKFGFAPVMYNPKNNNYIHFQCKPREMFAEILTIEQMQYEIDRAYAEYLIKEDAKNAEINRILGR